MKNEEIMKIAIEEAKKAYSEDEVPVGAVIIDENNEIIAKAHNIREQTQNAITHAEINAIQIACKKIGYWRLEKCKMYVTMEPCIMCAGAIINSRIEKVYIGAKDKRVGCISGKLKLFDNNEINHNPKYEFNILEDECSELLTKYFKTKRYKSKK